MWPKIISTAPGVPLAARRLLSTQRPRTVGITGVEGGVGRALSAGLARQGFTVVGISFRPEAPIPAVSEQRHADLRDPKQVRAPCHARCPHALAVCGAMVARGAPVRALLTQARPRVCVGIGRFVVPANTHTTMPTICPMRCLLGIVVCVGSGIHARPSLPFAHDWLRAAFASHVFRHVRKCDPTTVTPGAWHP